ncbi:partitioning defective 3 homolog isoform X3 [Sitodiplosis mosellana]|uniref:partitioning defective 3 homolog isoform X3 n=1 Tax=Sitodiplosis mosellana TaxID=263140 RepID=UPI0024453941|nr:partitioning defective 3 homolog isoform X3 [Sitodiplosis mosellana]XP_055303491.1 partitioning defective 3 homolog isoform X3 [Sitodiplosis mosellana]XP_055303492.1 partitioning defective 3 homolog isoform X3 [Sitodiplosis mosellana]XP_055303493.1 partitioning defective 3 homolog isoform X3 [Sitodiplosis mosellana]XP_055303494.1 partitioning defective 3 homolog isoform X3 [Sitodiplosis mosellana]XP_055303495.1 partitioning defective 3 homolog isoform X3 [Sitodiplosis mosellana]XP_05530349
MFDVPPKCPALADKLTGLFSWRQTYRVHHRQKGITHTSYLNKRHSLTLSQSGSSSDRAADTSTTDPDSWTVVHHLETQSGGILDTDDQVNDVADDRELIVANFEDAGPDPGVPQGGGDGASGSSVGTGSPDIFYAQNESKYGSTHETNTDTNNIAPHIEVTDANQLNTSGVGLQVRRSSDPSLHQIGMEIPNNPIVNNFSQYNDATKRWSAAPVCRTESDHQMNRSLGDGDRKTNASQLSPSWESQLVEPAQYQPQPPLHLPKTPHLSPNEAATPTQFSRSGRLSMQFLGDGNGYKWIDAAEKVQNPVSSSYTTKSLPRELKRKEPLGQAYESIREKNGKMLLIINENRGPLGLSAIPDPKNGGLLVQNVDNNSPAERGGLQRGDRILEINGFKLIGVSESSIQDYLRQNCAAPELRLRVIKTTNLIQKLKKEIDDMVQAEEKQQQAAKSVNTSPTRKVPGTLSSNALALQMANKRKIGRKIEIELCKGPQGLGFSVTTRDHQTGGDSLIYIKKILSVGAAIEDGRLRPGDRLLEVDGVTMTGKSQSEVVEILRATKPGSKVRLVVSRQQDLSELSDDKDVICETKIEQENDKTTPPKPPPPVLPQKPILRHSARKSLDLSTTSIEENNIHSPIKGFGRESISSNGSEQNHSFSFRNREILTLHIPVNDTEKAGLGVSVKGKTGSQNSSNDSNGSRTDGDLGIFVKSVLKGGAASRDGRLKMNDQLLMVNGVSLLGQSNAEAMSTLRKTMVHLPGKYPKMITLQVARRVTRPNSTIEPHELSNNSTSSASEQSGKTVIYLSPDKNNQNESMHAMNNGNSSSQRSVNRWSNPVLDRLTGGVGNHMNPNQKSNGMPHLAVSSGLRNESYYMATNDSWSPMQMKENNSVLIEDDQEPLAPIFNMDNSLNRTHDSNSSIHKQPVSPSSPNPCETTYSSQLSLETNPPVDPFSRDAIGRRSMSEKHHAALDAKETDTYQRNKKLREERERRTRPKTIAGLGSMESIVKAAKNTSTNGDLNREALDRITDLGPSLGMKKSSSLESLQTIVQEIQLSDEPRGPSALRTPRGRGRDEFVRAEVERPSRKHWLLESNSGTAVENDDGFINRHGPFQSSLNEGKHKRAKKPGILRGIGHMFRFGKHRKDGIAAVDSFDPNATMNLTLASKSANKENKSTVAANGLNASGRGKPPNYQPPPPVAIGIPVASNGIHQNDVFNHRYSHYVNYDELQQQISRRHQHYHSQRSTRTVDLNNHHQRPTSTYYEYETFQYNGGIGNYNPNMTSPPSNFNHHIALNGSQRKIHNGQSPLKYRSPGSQGGSMRNRGPFVTQVTIREHVQPNNGHSPSNAVIASTSKV